MRIAHIADIHFCERYRSVALECLGFAREEAAKAKAQAGVWAGDLFDSSVTLGKNDLTNDLDREVQKWADIFPVVGVEGNHDVFGSGDHFSRIKAKHPILIASRPGVVTFAGAQFMLLPFPRKAWLAQQASSVREMQEMEVAALRQIIVGMHAQTTPDQPRILVYHNSMSGAKLDSGQTLTGKRIDLCAADVNPFCDYGALGDIHLFQPIGSNCWYPGSVYHGDYGEVGPRRMLIVDVHPGGYEIVDQIILPSVEKLTLHYNATKEGSGVTAKPEYIKDVDLRLKVMIERERVQFFDEALLKHEILALYPGQSPKEIVIDYDKQDALVVREELSQLAEAKTLREEALVWAKVNNTVLSESVLAKLDHLELEERGIA